MDVRLGTRSIPKYKANLLSGYMARGAGREARTSGFDYNDVKELYGKGEIRGTIDFSTTYGPPEEAPVRRLTVSIEFILSLPADGNGMPAYGDNIIEEHDEPINNS
jgi:hypothetical protein